MRVRSAVWLLVLAVACSDSSNDVVGPFSGPVHRFVVDRIDVPRDTSDADAVAGDLDGDGKPDNKFGYATAVLAGTNDLTTNASDMIASGALASVVEIHADDLSTDDRAGVYYLGTGGSFITDAETVAVGGRFAGGVFTPNRTRDARHPGSGIVRLPVFTNADPVSIPIVGLEIDLVPDGAGGYDATIRGAIRERVAREAALVGLLDMFRTEPARHLVFQRGVDEDHDDLISYEELEVSVIGLLVAADIQLFDGTDFGAVAGSQAPDSVSVAFAVHLAPCDAGRCSTVQPQTACRDRAVDGGETDVDCGGPCQACAAGLMCGGPVDCQSNACDGGICRGPTCSDGVRDGYESDIDCGGACPGCAAGKACAADRDCASNNCSNGVVSLGTCS